MPDISHWDVLVVGAGLAGEMAAVRAARLGRRVAVLSKTEPFRTHSRFPRGVNLSLQAGDDWRQQAEDIWNDSHFLADWDAVDVVCHEGPEVVLREFGDLLDRDDRGNVVAHDYAGTSRGIMSGNHTGLSFMRRLYGELRQRGVPVLIDRTITSLALDEGRCVGVTALNMLTGEVEGYAARSLILCTGGYGYVYQNTAHGPENAGDGHALGYRAGAALRDVEFLYFHHSNVYGTPLIITEGAYNQGVPLFNRDDEEFLGNYLSPGETLERYYMKRYMAMELDAGRGVEGKYFYADYSRLGEEYVNRHFPRTRKACMDTLGIDIVRDRVPVVLGVQASLGGIAIDLDGSTAVPGLYAAGECACPGVHGADWRVGNPMLSALVFGSRAGVSAAGDGDPGDDPSTSLARVEQAVQTETVRLEEIALRSSGTPYHLIRGELRRTMSEDVAVLRDAAKLERALATIHRLQDQYSNACMLYQGMQFNEQLVDFLGLGSMLPIAEAIATAAYERTESRGTHWRRDFPDRDDAHWMVHSFVTYTPGSPKLTYVPVQLGEFRPRETVIIR